MMTKLRKTALYKIDNNAVFNHYVTLENYL